MEYGVSNLRSGKGALYVKSSGNSWGGGCGPDGDIDMPCTEALSDPSSSSPYLIIVGALNANDVRSSYSTPGAGLWVAGYGGEYGQTDPAIMTTDQTSCDAGYAATGVYTNDFEYGQNEENPDCNYTSTFNGTSSAAPTVAGVIALMLEANSDLTWRDVKHIIAETSYQVDPTSSKELAGITQYAWVTNGANYTHHPIYGFGRIDAGAAIAAAKSYTADSMGDFVESENTFVRDTNDSSLEYEIDSSTQNQWTFTQTAIGTTDFIEFITLSFELNHTIFDDIGITLTSPSGTEIRVLTPFTDASINPNNSSFDIGVSGFYGEPLEGEWTLSVTDYTDDSVGGTMKSFTVKTYGH
jgi:subtilisin-like proprotein convertase family protein